MMSAQLGFVVGKFPGFQKQILELTMASPDFRSACEDYNRVRSALLHSEAEGPDDGSPAAELRRLRDELEAEILGLLNTPVEQPITPHHGSPQNDTSGK